MWFVAQVDPVVGVGPIVGTTPATRKSVDLNCLVAVWVTEFSDQLSEQADRIMNVPAQLERAFSALDTRLINAEKRNDETMDRITARILAIETGSAAASSVTGSSVPSDPGSSPAGSTSTGTQGQRRNLVDNERVVKPTLDPSAWCSPGLSAALPQDGDDCSAIRFGFPCPLLKTGVATWLRGVITEDNNFEIRCKTCSLSARLVFPSRGQVPAIHRPAQRRWLTALGG